MMGKAGSIAYRTDIDGLRAVAVLLVLVFHFSLLPGGDAGFIGVDVFFVISGYLVTSILCSQIASGSFELRKFYANRVRRLAPALFATLLLTLLAGAIVLFPRQLVDLAKQVLASQLYLSNIYYWRVVNYFGLQSDSVYLLHTWSLAVEEQFYLLYPVLVLFIGRVLGLQRLWLGIAAITAGTFALNVLMVGSKPEATFYLLPTRAWELLMGALAWMYVARTTGHSALNAALGWAGAALIVLAVVVFRPTFGVPGFFALLPTLGATFVLLGGSGQANALSGFLSLRAMRYVGDLSYPLYLVHWPLNVFGRLVFEKYGYVERFGMFVLSFALAALIYHAVERPVRSRKLLQANGKLLLAYASGLILSVVVSVAIVKARGVPQRFPDDVVRLASYVEDRSPPLDECEFGHARGAGGYEPCVIGEAKAAPKWLVIGDSHAWAAHRALEQWLRDNAESGLFVYQHGCPPLIGIYLTGDTKNQCHAMNQWAIGALQGHPQLSGVILISTWRQALEGRLSTSASDASSVAESVRLFTDLFGKTVHAYRDLGKAVYVWEPVPGARGDVPMGLAQAALGRPASPLTFSMSEYRNENAYFFTALRQNCDAIRAVFSPAKKLCDSGVCAIEDKGRPLYFDNSHITDSTADYWQSVLQNPLACQ